LLPRLHGGADNHTNALFADEGQWFLPAEGYLAMSKEQMIGKKAPTVEDDNGTPNFLSLIFPAAKCNKLLRGLRAEANFRGATKDLLRAANLPLLPSDEPHVDEDLKRIHKGKPLAPVLLVRGVSE
jgi:hypothetical protein